MGTSLVILVFVLGVAMFLLKLLMAKSARWVERSFNAEVAIATQIANDHLPPPDWLTDAAAARGDEQSKRRLLARLDQVIRRVDGGKAFEPDAREFALGELQAVRARWQEQSFAQIRAAHASVAQEEAPR